MIRLAVTVLATAEMIIIMIMTMIIIINND